MNYVENTNVLTTSFESSAGSFEVTDFAPRFRQDGAFQRPNLLIRILRPLTGMPQALAKCRLVYDYGCTDLRPEPKSGQVDYHGAAWPMQLYTNCSLELILEERPFVVDRTFYFALHCGSPFPVNVRQLCEAYLEMTVDYWRRWVKHCHLPMGYQKEVIRSALTLKIHQYEDTGAIIASPTTSIPEADGSGRNWDYRYCWLRDAFFTLAALRRLGQFEEMEGFVGYLHNIAAESDGRLQPVYGISGERQLTETVLKHLAGYRGNAPVRIGNQAHEHLQHDVYGEMLISISPLFLDARFTAADAARPKALLRKLLGQVEAFIEAEDAGLWEYRGIAQVHAFSVLMHWAGARQALRIAQRGGDAGLEGQALRLMQRSSAFLNERCWDRQGLAYTQAPGSRELDASLLLMVSLGFLTKDDPRAVPHVEAIAARLGARDGLIRRYVHADDFGGTANTFTVCGFWLAESYARLGLADKGRRLFEALLGCANPLCLYSEDVDPLSREQWGNFPQAYSHVGLINAAFTLSDPWE